MWQRTSELFSRFLSRTLTSSDNIKRTLPPSLDQVLTWQQTARSSSGVRQVYNVLLLFPLLAPFLTPTSNKKHSISNILALPRSPSSQLRIKLPQHKHDHWNIRAASSDLNNIVGPKPRNMCMTIRRYRCTECWRVYREVNSGYKRCLLPQCRASRTEYIYIPKGFCERCSLRANWIGLWRMLLRSQSDAATWSCTATMLLGCWTSTGSLWLVQED